MKSIKIRRKNFGTSVLLIIISKNWYMTMHSFILFLLKVKHPITSSHLPLEDLASVYKINPEISNPRHPIKHCENNKD